MVSAKQSHRASQTNINTQSGARKTGPSTLCNQRRTVLMEGQPHHSRHPRKLAGDAKPGVFAPAGCPLSPDPNGALVLAAVDPQSLRLLMDPIDELPEDAPAAPLPASPGLPPAPPPRAASPPRATSPRPQRYSGGRTSPLIPEGAGGTWTPLPSPGVAQRTPHFGERHSTP